MFELLALFTGVSQPAPPPKPTLGKTAWIFSTVDHSEFCPAGNVRVDLNSGRYEHVARASRGACNNARLERPVRSGRLRGHALTAIRTAYLRVLDEGLETQACQEGNGGDKTLISNGGTPILLLATGRFSAAAPDNLTCWTGAASRLQDLLDKTFSSTRQH
jgi:hypothetical protein